MVAPSEFRLTCIAPQITRIAELRRILEYVQSSTVGRSLVHRKHMAGVGLMRTLSLQMSI